MVETLIYKLDQTRKPLFDELVKYTKQNVTPFDVPGHKQGRGIHSEFKKIVGENIFKMDVNSSKQIDLLSNPTGVIKEAEELAADCFGADNAFFMVNGSTASIQNMILSTVRSGEKIILPRNVHKSTINALVLSGAKPVYLKPYTDEVHGVSMGVSFIDVKNTIDANLDAAVLFMLSPTYFGVTSDLEKIIKYAHSFNIPVIVDEAHGSHFGFSNRLSENSIRYGADISTMSIHKTGGSLTQSSIMLHNNGLIPLARVRSVINLSQTSSASYLLLASLDIARHKLVNDTNFEKIIDLAIYAKKEIDSIPGLFCLSEDIENGDSIYRTDPTKLVINVSGLNITGFAAYDLLKEKFNIQLELGETNVVLAVISVGDTMDNINILISALRKLSKAPGKTEAKSIKYKMNIPISVLTPREAFFSESETISIDNCLGRVSGDSIMIYPPGIPLIVPGEVFSQEILNDYSFFNNQGNAVVGSSINEGKIQLKVLKEVKQ